MVKDILWHKLLKRPYRLEKVIDQGDGRINILLIHGLASRSRIWQPLVDILDKDKYRVRSFDLLGFGVSPKPKSVKYTTKDHAKALLYTLSKDSMPDEKFILVGHSMGCIIATHIAYLRPDMVSGVVLYKPPLLLDKKEKRSFHKRFYSYIARKPASMAKYVNLASKFSISLLGFNMKNDEVWRPIANSLNNTILAQQTIRELELLTKPTEIIYGRFDFLVSKVKAKQLQKINPNLRLHYVPEAHDVKPKSSRYMKKLIEQLPK